MKNQNPWNLFSCILRSTADFWTNGRAIYEEIPSPGPGEGPGAGGGSREETTEEKIAKLEAWKNINEPRLARLDKMDADRKAEQELNARVDLWIDFAKRVREIGFGKWNKDWEIALTKIDKSYLDTDTNRRKALRDQFQDAATFEAAVKQVLEAGYNIDWGKAKEGNAQLTELIDKLWSTSKPNWAKKQEREKEDRTKEELGAYVEGLNEIIYPEEAERASEELDRLADAFSGAHAEAGKDIGEFRARLVMQNKNGMKYSDLYNLTCELSKILRNYKGTSAECNRVFAISAGKGKLALAQAAQNITWWKPDEVKAAREAIANIEKGNSVADELVKREETIWNLRQAENEKARQTAVAAAGGAAPPPASAGAPAPSALGSGAGPGAPDASPGIHDNRAEATNAGPNPPVEKEKPKAPAAPRGTPERKALTDARRVDIMKKYLDGTLKGKISTDGFKAVFGVELTGGAVEVAKAVRGIQEKLNAKLKGKKQKPIKVDGILGPKTYAALVAAGNEALEHSGDIHAFLKGEEKKPEPAEVAAAPAPAAAPAAAPKAPEAPPPTAEILPNPDRRNGRFIRDAVDGLKTGDIVYVVGDAIPAQEGYKQIEKSDGTRLKMREGNLATIDAKNREHLQAWDKFLAARFLKFRGGAKTTYLPQIDPSRIYMYQGNPVYFESKSGDETVVRNTAGLKNTIRGKVELTPADSNEQAQYVVLRYKEAQRAHDVETAYQQAEAYVENQQRQQRAAEKASAEAKPEAPPATGG